MFFIHYLENNTSVLNTFSERIPEANEQIKIKGRKGKVINVIQADGHKYYVHVDFEKIVKKETSLMDDKKKRR